MIRLILLVALGVGAAGCAVVPSEAPLAAAEPPRSFEDATSEWLGEEEVDVAAALRGPLDPVYPEEALRAHYETEVVAKVAVRADGKVIGVRVVESPTEAFTEAAEEALWKADFAPARKGRDPVSSTATLRIRFRVDAR